jgi:hypothetical protein
MPYCPECGVEVDAADKFCSECGHDLGETGESESERMRTSEDGSRSEMNQTELPSGGWWLAVLFPAAMVTIAIALTFIGGIFGSDLSNLMGDMVYYSTILSVFISPIGFHMDKKYVKEASGWEPPSVYYLLFLPVLNIFLSLGYIQQRHDVVGYP